MGRKPKPNALKDLDGNPGKRPYQQDQPQIETDRLPEPPDWLCKEGVAKWYEIGDLLFRYGLLTNADTEAFAGYCKAFARWKEAELMIDKEGQVITTVNQKGYEYSVRSPWTVVAKESMATMMKFMKEFGLTPSARAGLVLKEPEPKDPFAELLKRKDKNVKKSA